MKRQFTIYNFSIFNWERGFTMVELLTAVLIVATVSSLIGIILTFSLRGSNKTNTINEVRQNGNYAIFQIAKMIEYARSFDGVSTDGLNYSYNCVQALPPSPSPTPPPVHYLSIRITNFDWGQTVFSCSDTTIASNGASLIDLNSVSLDTNSCYFTCVQKRITEVPIIGINFSLSKFTTSSLLENKSTTSFQTSATMRNLGK